MKNGELEESLDIIDQELKKQGISRRDALKIAGLGSASFLMGGQDVEAATTAQASEAKGKIVIVGGGLAGVSTAARLMNSLANPDVTVIEPNPQSVSYQPGNTLIGAGLYSKEDILYDTKDFMPKGVKWIQEKAVAFDPENNQLTTASNKTITYDFLVVAAGLTVDFGKIKGLESLKDRLTMDDCSQQVNLFGNSGACTVYTADGAVQTWKQMQRVIEEAKSGKKVKTLFTHPNTAVKCGGAPKKMMYLYNSRLMEAGQTAKDNTEMVFYANQDKLFGVKEYAKAIEEQFIERDFQWHFKHNLTEVDLQNNIATFDKRWNVKGPWDEDLEEFSEITKHEDVKVEFDFMHISPPMKAPDEIGKSKIGSRKGWVPVNKETLQHVKFKNVFSLGDIAAVPLGKTGGTVRKQYKVLVDNLIATMEGKEMPSKFDGYTVCPLITDIGKVMLAEFDWSMKPTPSFPLDPTKERYIWWIMKYYLLKPMTQYGMLSGKA